MKTIIASFLAFAFLLPSMTVQAATMDVSWSNEYTVNRFMLWVEDPTSTVTMTSVTLKDQYGNALSDWNIVTNTGTEFYAWSPTNVVAPGNLYADITFSDKATSFTVEWGEVLRDSGGALLDEHTGVNYYTANKRPWKTGTWEYTQDPISHATPIPSTIWLLAAGLVCPIIIRMRASSKRIQAHLQSDFA